MNATKLIFTFTLLSVNCLVATSLKCYFCSYFEFKNGTKAPAHRVWDNYKVTPFCDEFHPSPFNTVDSIEVSNSNCLTFFIANQINPMMEA